MLHQRQQTATMRLLSMSSDQALGLWIWKKRVDQNGLPQRPTPGVIQKIRQTPSPPPVSCPSPTETAWNSTGMQGAPYHRYPSRYKIPSRCKEKGGKEQYQVNRSNSQEDYKAFKRPGHYWIQNTVPGTKKNSGSNSSKDWTANHISRPKHHSINHSQ